MKKGICLLLAALCLCLTGCTPPPPEKAADGGGWDESWVTVGGVLGVDTPEGLTARENNDSLSANGMFYATWSMGEGEPYTNEDGDEATLYDAQIYVLLAGYTPAEKAESTLDEWIGMAENRYTVENRTEQTCNGQPFTVLDYSYDSDTNPYDRGMAAYGVYRNYAICVELSCRESFTGDEAELMAEFLEHCHYGT